MVLVRTRLSSAFHDPSFDSPEAVEGTCDQRNLWSDSAVVQAVLSLRWSQRSYCRFCRALAHIIIMYALHQV